MEKKKTFGVVQEARLAQTAILLAGFGYTLSSTLEKGFYAGTILFPILSLLSIAFAETKIRDEV